MNAVSSVARITVVVFVAVGSLFANASARAQECGSTIEVAVANEASLHYFECGEGEPVVFVHGAFGDLESFSSQVDTFATTFRVIAYSRRYHPPNKPPEGDDVWTLQLHANDLAALINEIDAGPAHVVAHSGGAYIALRFALDHPQLVRSLILAEPPVLSILSQTSVGDALRDSWNARVLNPVRRAFERGELERGVRQFLDSVIYEGWFENLPPSAQEYLVDDQGPTFRLYMLTDPSQALPPIACEAYHRLERPTLLVTGEKSPAMLLLASAELERCLPAESHAMIPEAGHGMQSENPAAFNRTVLDYLARQ